MAESFTCTICGKQYKTSGWLTKHVATHSAPTPIIQCSPIITTSSASVICSPVINIGKSNDTPAPKKTKTINDYFTYDDLLLIYSAHTYNKNIGWDSSGMGSIANEITRNSKITYVDLCSRVSDTTLVSVLARIKESKSNDYSSSKKLLAVFGKLPKAQIIRLLNKVDKKFVEKYGKSAKAEILSKLHNF
jgi:hypothetical protein